MARGGAAAGFTVRPMTAQDVSAIVGIDSRLSGKERSPSYPQKVTRYLEMYYPPLCFVAEAGGRVAGFILGDVRGWEYALPPSGWIDIIGVDPACQGQGVGKALAEAFVRECHRQGMKTHIVVRKADRRLRRFLASLGFQSGELLELEH